MKPLNQTDLALMQEVQEAAMLDRCRIGRYITAARDEFNRPVELWEYDATLTPCGYDGQPSKEVLPGTNVPVYDAKVRLPLATQLANTQRIQIVARVGTAIEPELFSVVGVPRRGPSGYVLLLRRISDGS